MHRENVQTLHRKEPRFKAWNFIITALITHFSLVIIHSYLGSVTQPAKTEVNLMEKAISLSNIWIKAVIPLIKRMLFNRKGQYAIKRPAFSFRCKREASAEQWKGQRQKEGFSFSSVSWNCNVVVWNAVECKQANTKCVFLVSHPQTSPKSPLQWLHHAWPLARDLLL